MVAPLRRCDRSIASDADHEADFGLEVELGGGSVGRASVVAAPRQTPWPDHRSPRHDERAGSAVIPDRHVMPVDGKGGRRGTEDPSAVLRVLLGREEIDVVRDLEREKELDAIDPMQEATTDLFVPAVGDPVGHCVPDPHPHARPGAHQWVERCSAQQRRVVMVQLPRRAADVEDVVPDPDADPRWLPPFGDEDPEGKVGGSEA